MKIDYQYIIQRLSFVAALFFVFWLPLFEGFMPTIFGVWIGFWLLEGNFKTRFTQFPFKSNLNLLFLAYFFLSFIALLYTSDQNKGGMDVQQKLALFAFPILLGGSSSYFWKNSRWIFWAFIAGLLVASIYDLQSAYVASKLAGVDQEQFRYWVYERHENVDFLTLISMRMSYFSYGYLSQFMHPSYFSMYLLFGIAVLLQNLKKHHSYLKNGFVLFLVLFFTSMIYFLQSTAGFIGFMVLVISAIFIELSLFKKLTFLIPFFALILIFGTILSRSQLSKHQDIPLLSIEKDSISTSSSIRVELWKNTIELIENQFLLGCGPGDTRELVKTQFLKKGLAEYATGDYNMHNQFLESLVGLGVFGLGVLIAILFLVFQKAIQQKNKLLFYLAILILINFLFESVLNRQAGIFFAMYFISLLILLPQKKALFSAL